MISSFTKVAAVAATLATAAHAFQSISVPAVIAADQDFTLTVTTNDTDSAYTSYRVYLDTTPPGYTGGPSCYLANSTSVSTTTLSLTIPAAFGPPGLFYSLSTQEFPTNTSTPDLYTSSASFNLTGATGNWSAYENALQGSPLWPASDLPCSAYACARTCAMNAYPADETPGSQAQTDMEACIKKCPGVSVPASTSSSASASATGKATSTGSAKGALTSASSGVSSASASATGTGAAVSTGAAGANAVSAAMLAAAAGLVAVVV